jgi:nicotinamidase-related amidase
MLLKNNTALVIIDVQEKLFRAMYEKENLLENLQKLVKGTSLLGIPAIITEQNPAGLGLTVPELAGLLKGIKPIPKMSFNCLDENPFAAELKKLKTGNIILTGIESHICVYQTALDLMDNGYTVYIAADCVSSRAKSNMDIALSEMSRRGAWTASVEMVLFELLKTAADPLFKDISRIIK